MSHSPVGKPVAIVGNWQVLLAPVANWLGRRSNAMTDDFVDRLARRAGIKKVVHCTYRIPACQNAKPEYAAVNLPRPFKQQIARARCLLATAGRRETTEACILAWSDRGVHALSLLRFDTQPMFAPKATSCGERAKPSVSCGPAALRVQRIGRTTEAISMRKSWKPSECDQTGSLHRLVGDFASEDHLFIDLMINHRVRPSKPLGRRGRARQSRRPIPRRTRAAGSGGPLSTKG